MGNDLERVMELWVDAAFHFAMTLTGILRCASERMVDALPTTSSRIKESQDTRLSECTLESYLLNGDK